MKKDVFAKLCGILVLFVVFSGFVSAAAAVGYINPVRLAIATTTSTTVAQQSDVRCEAVNQANEKTCMQASCPDNYDCKYVPSAAAAIVGYCKCVQKVTTKTQPSEVRCEAIKGPNEKTCVDGVCPSGYDCDYVPSAAAANVGYCKCVSTTTTTLPSEVRCEAVKYPSANSCAPGVCPQGAKCRYVASAAAVANIGYCKCVYDTTTTTTLSSQETPCERILKPSSASSCSGACPQGMRCMFKPKVQSTANLAALSPSGESSCVCVEYTTTTTLYPKCEDLTDLSGPTCKRGLCPPNSVCRPRAAVQQASLAYVNLKAKGCECVPCDCVDSTTTTLPQQVLCERVVSPSAATCEAGLCPDNQKCRVFTAVVGNDKISKCACVGETTTTLPAIKCDGLISGSADKCALASCPQGYKCKFYPPAATTAANSVGSCKCAPDTTPPPTPPTIPPQNVLCENVQNPSGGSCEVAKCPDGQKCKVFTATVGNGQISKCACVGETTTTQPPYNCDGLISGSSEKCDQASCPQGYACKFYPSTAANAVGTCKCVQAASQTTTTLRSAPPEPKPGFLEGILKAIFG